MSSIPYDVFVFDFDGTLVQSAAAKRQAFFDIFLTTHAPAVDAVLADNTDASRFAVIPKIVKEIAKRGLPAHETDTSGLIDAYTSRAIRYVDNAPEVPNASAILRALSESGAIYIVSMTPHDQLIVFVKQRGWFRYNAGVFGYPNHKTTSVAAILTRHAIPPKRLLVVGDGISDAQAAEANGCEFHRINSPSDLMTIPGLAFTDNV